MTMTTEEIMKPRYKVIADYPNSQYSMGDIINGCEQIITKKGLRDISNYPHLFKKLEWWEDRNPEDMPLYVKAKEACCIVVTHYKKGEVVKVSDLNTKGVFEYFLPANKSEYNAYINQNKTAKK